jgi:hypothetical protein
MTLKSTKPKKNHTSASDAPPLSEAPPFTMSPRKVALVAVDWKALYEGDETQRACWEDGGFYPLFPDIARVCDQAGCDTILYALWSHSERRHGALAKQKLFGRKPECLRWVILEMNQWKEGVLDPVHVADPWQVFHDGRKMSQSVKELKHDLGLDIRIGVIDLPTASGD